MANVLAKCAIIHVQNVKELKIRNVQSVMQGTTPGQIVVYVEKYVLTVMNLTKIELVMESLKQFFSILRENDGGTLLPIL